MCHSYTCRIAMYLQNCYVSRRTYSCVLHIMHMNGTALLSQACDLMQRPRNLVFSNRDNGDRIALINSLKFMDSFDGSWLQCPNLRLGWTWRCYPVTTRDPFAFLLHRKGDSCANNQWLWYRLRCAPKRPVRQTTDRSVSLDRSSLRKHRCGVQCGL